VVDTSGRSRDGSVMDPVELRIHELLRACPTISCHAPQGVNFGCR
jgi:hypothetical protein